MACANCLGPAAAELFLKSSAIIAARKAIRKRTAEGGKTRPSRDGGKHHGKGKGKDDKGKSKGKGKDKGKGKGKDKSKKKKKGARARSASSDGSSASFLETRAELLQWP